jgi:DNA-binding NarL/FixJ family response regulator
MKKIKIFIVDDHPIFLKGLLSQLNEFSFVEVIGYAVNGIDFIEKIENCEPDIVIMDIKMPEMNGVDATKEALKRKPNLKIIALSMLCDEESIREMLKVGAKGFLLKNIEKGDLEKAILIVMKNQIFFSKELNELLPLNFYTFNYN